MPPVGGLNEILSILARDFFFGLGFFVVLLLLIRLLPDFARNLTLVLASLAAIEIYTSPFFTFGLVAVTGLVYYGLFWLQWNPRKALFCRLISGALVLGLIGLLILFRLGGLSLLSGLHALGAVFLTLRLLLVARTVGNGQPLPSDPLEFFVYAFFFPTFFMGPLERLDSFRNNLTTEHRPALSWKNTGWSLARIVVGIVKIGLAVRFLPLAISPLGALTLFIAFSGTYDVLIGGVSLAGYRLSEKLQPFPLGTLVSKEFLVPLGAVGLVALGLAL